MNVAQESFLRGLGIFIGTFFTTGWAIKSKLGNDELYMVLAIIAGVVAAHFKYK